MSPVLARIAGRIILAAIKGHPTYAFASPGDRGIEMPDRFAQCKCTACRIARAANIGLAECESQEREAWRRLKAEAAERDRIWFEQTFPDWNEVPF